MSESPRTQDIEALVRQFQGSDLTELHVRMDGFQLFLSRNADGTTPWDGVGGPVPSPSAKARPNSRASQVGASASSAREAEEAIQVPNGMQAVCAPYLGHFYRAPKPGEPNYVEVGQQVEPGSDLCLIEVMKLFTAVRAETKGVVRHVYAVDGQMVQEGQPLFAIEPVA